MSRGLSKGRPKVNHDGTALSPEVHLFGRPTRIGRLLSATVAFDGRQMAPRNRAAAGLLWCLVLAGVGAGAGWWVSNSAVVTVLIAVAAAGLGAASWGLFAATRMARPSEVCSYVGTDGFARFMRCGSDISGFEVPFADLVDLDIAESPIAGEPGARHVECRLLGRRGAELARFDFVCRSASTKPPTTNDCHLAEALAQAHYDWTSARASRLVRAA